MKSSYKLKKYEVWEGLYPRIFFLIQKNKWSWQSIGAIFGLGGAIFSIIMAVSLPFAAYWLLAGGSVSFIKEISFVFLALALPLMAFGAHCLDLLEKTSNVSSVSELQSGSLKPRLKPQTQSSALR